jgi:hypothetical protein
MEALKPAEVRAAQAQQGVKGKDRRRKNAAYRRQGEWFFLPAPHLKVDKKLIVRDEPLSRGNGGKPHWAESCCFRCAAISHIVRPARMLHRPRHGRCSIPP